MEKVPTVPNLVLEDLEINSALKQNFYIRYREELKHTKNPYYSPFR